MLPVGAIAHAREDARARAQNVTHALSASLSLRARCPNEMRGFLALAIVAVFNLSLDEFTMLKVDRATPAQVPYNLTWRLSFGIIAGIIGTLGLDVSKAEEVLRVIVLLSHHLDHTIGQASHWLAILKFRAVRARARARSSFRGAISRAAAPSLSTSLSLRAAMGGGADQARVRAAHRRRAAAAGRGHRD